MTIESPFLRASAGKPAELTRLRGLTLAAHFSSPAAEYEAARGGAALFDRSHRGLLVARGADRKSWLHNLVTNVVATLGDNEGVYAFAVDIKGRTQFDLNVLSLPDALWLDIDAATVPAARNHLVHYLILEDVTLEDASGRLARLGCAGPRAAQVARLLGQANLSAMAALSSAGLEDGRVRLVRHDFVGLPGFELIVPLDQAAAWWDRLALDCGAVPAGLTAAEALRIEAGVPAWGADIDDKVIPPETGQSERGISFQKGCYLGQEIIERMRSSGSLARRLTRLNVERGEDVRLPAPLYRDGHEVGRLTSLVRHPLREEWIGLGYLRTSVGDPRGLMLGDPPRAVRPAEPAQV